MLYTLVGIHRKRIKIKMIYERENQIEEDSRDPV